MKETSSAGTMQRFWQPFPLLIRLLVDFSVSEIEYLKLTDPKTVGERAGALRFDLILSDESIHPYRDHSECWTAPSIPRPEQ
jgi:hypothetical protein